MTEAEADQMLGGYIRTHRNYKGLTVGAVSWATGIPRDRIRCLERGNVFISIRPKECHALADALGLDAADLMARAVGGC